MASAHSSGVGCWCPVLSPWHIFIPSCRSCLSGVTSICTVSTSMAESMGAAVLTPIMCGSVTCGSIVGSGFGTSTTLVRIGNVTSVLKRCCPGLHGRCIRYVQVANGLRLLRTAGGLRLPGAARSASPVSTAGGDGGGGGSPQHAVSGRPVDLGPGGAGRSGRVPRSGRLSGAYEHFQPDHFDRHKVNRQLHAVVWAAEETP